MQSSSAMPPSILSLDFHRLRVCETELVTQCQDIEKRCFLGVDITDISRELHRAGVSIICALDDGDVKQCLGYLIMLRKSIVLSICKLAVAPAARGMGIGTQLIQRAVRYAREMKIRQCSLHVEESNASALHLYSKVGFMTQERKENYYDIGRHAIYMEFEV